MDTYVDEWCQVLQHSTLVVVVSLFARHGGTSRRMALCQRRGGGANKHTPFGLHLAATDAEKHDHTFHHPHHAHEDTRLYLLAYSEGVEREGR